MTGAGVRPKIGVGFRWGKLYVSEPTAERKNGYTVWRCVCDCGGEILLDTRALQRGTVRDCGCETRVTPGQRDLTGQRFGRLICLAPTTERDGSGGLIWKCQCDCGKETSASAHSLLTGLKKSCGCLGHPPLRDLVDQKFGRLTVIGYAGKISGSHRWECRCDCGGSAIVRQDYLTGGRTQSCGCLASDTLRDRLQLFDGTSITMLESMRDRLLSSNTSGYTGVYLQKRTEKWAAQITFKGKTYFLGTFTNKQDAVKARHRAEEHRDSFISWYYEELRPLASSDA